MQRDAKEMQRDKNNNVESMETDQSFEEATTLINDSLEVMNCSPLKSYVRPERAYRVGKRKINELAHKFSSAVAVALTEPELANTECENCTRLVNEIKEKLLTSDKDKIVQLLTIVPEDWSIQKTVDFFGVSEYTVKQARKVKAERGILGGLPGYSRQGISDEIKNLITNFYESDEVSRMCPGKKDCVSIKLPNGTRDKMQKRLLLSNISEIFSHFKLEHPDVKVGFSTFALLRPKWCVPVGAAGSHNVCVCTYHQNVKLMVNTINASLDYKDVLLLCVCDITNETCMLHHCDKCPEQGTVKEFLKEQLLQNYSIDSVIKYKQWVTTDRSQLEDKEEPFEDFIEILSNMLHELTEHHYIAKKQGQFFKDLKSSLDTNECVLVLDFAENYSFVVQDCAQGFH